MNSKTLNTDGDQDPWYKHRWPWLLMLGPGIIVMAGIYMSKLAFENQDALVVGDYYKKGKAINQDLRRDHEASARGLALELDMRAEESVLAGVVTAKGQPLAGTIELHFAHATQPEKDVRLFAKTDAQGRFSLNMPALSATRWEVSVSDTTKQWRLAGTWHYPKSARLSLVADKA